MNDNVTRAFPHALGPEKSLLSSMLQDPQDFIPVAIEEGLTAAHFYMPNHSALFGHLLEFFSEGKEIELVSFVQMMLDRGELDKIGGPSSLTDLYTYAPSPGHFRHHAELVKDKFVLRSILNLCHVTCEAAYDAPGEAKETLGDFERGITAISALANGSVTLLTRKELLRASLEQYERRVRGEIDSVGMPTYPILDHYIRGLHGGRMYVIGAFPGGGKSTMSSEIVSSLVLSGEPCAYIPLEGTEDDAMTRIIIQSSGVVAMAYTDPVKFAMGNGGNEVTKLVMQKIHEAITLLAKAPLFISRPQTPTITNIVSLIRRLHREEGIKLAVVDYAQRIKSTGKFEGGDGAAKECSNALQDLAIELNIAIIVPSQLTEDGDTKHGKVWVEDADVVMRIIQDRNKESATYKRHRFVMIDKDRQNGSAGNRVPLVFDGDRIRFVEGVDETEVVATKPKFSR